jgi:hypothetical protein
MVLSKAWSRGVSVGIMDTEVLSNNDVSKKESFGWTYWIWDGGSQSWSIMWENADRYKVTSEETFM